MTAAKDKPFHRRGVRRVVTLDAGSGSTVGDPRHDPGAPKTAVSNGSTIALVVLLAAMAPVADHRLPYRQSSLHIAGPSACPDIRSLVAGSAPPGTRADIPVTGMLEYACDPQTHLAALFREVAGDAVDDLARGARWVRFVQMTNVAASPAHDVDGTAIYHPLWLLEHRLMDCSQTARLVVDGFIAAGIPARVLQMREHVSAEFYADGKWRLAEADVLAGGDFVVDAYGEHASLDDILAQPDLLLIADPSRELTQDAGIEPERFRQVFEAAVYPQSPLVTPYVIKKSVPPENAGLWAAIGWQDRVTAQAARLTQHYHGWNHYAFCRRSDPTCTN